MVPVVPKRPYFTICVEDTMLKSKKPSIPFNLTHINKWFKNCYEHHFVDVGKVLTLCIAFLTLTPAPTPQYSKIGCLSLEIKRGRVCRLIILKVLSVLSLWPFLSLILPLLSEKLPFCYCIMWSCSLSFTMCFVIFLSSFPFFLLLLLHFLLIWASLIWVVDFKDSSFFFL